MQGFKSFPDKTVLSFDQGITVVVGPNGSGKSNITDAVRWVLGEMSTKNIRGSKMEDVIFGGSDNRRPMGYAEVSLVIDNTCGTGKLESEYDEVTVTRRYYRGGDSEYLINGHTVRLRDIAELFMNTGVGKTGYSNIGQGKIAEIISQKSDERRSVFEEAAGISKYRFKKNEAERKLKDTEANLIRLGDLLSELGSRVGPLEKEAAAARKYLDLYEQKKEVDVSLWLYDAEAMRAKANETERAYMAAKLELESVDGEISALEEKSEKLYQKASEGQANAETIADKVSQYITRKHNIESSSKVLENDILHTESRIEQTQGELKARRLSLADGKKHEMDLERSVSACKSKLDGIVGEINSVAALISDQEKICSDSEKRILECEDEEKLVEAELLDIKVRLSALEGSREAENGRSAGIEEEINSAEELMARLSDAKKRGERTVSDYGQAMDAARYELDAKNRELEKLEGELGTLKEKLSSVKLASDAKRQRAEALRRMDELLEGYNYSVKNVMHGASGGQLRGICGPVSKVISVKPEYSIAIETALGANIQNIITENEEAAKAAISYLKRTNGGRATFYPITSVKAQSPNISDNDLRRQKGYVGMADALCECDRKYAGVIGYMLGRTAVFDHIDNAAFTAKAFGYRIRIVTLDGQLINAGGSFTGGSVKSDSGILTRTSEIEGLKNEITKLSLEKSGIELRINEISTERDGIKNETISINEKISLLNTMLQAEQTQYEVTKSRLDTETARRDALINNLAGLGAAHEQYDSEHRELTAKLRDAEKELESAKMRTGSAVSARNDADDRLAELESRQNGLLIARTAAEKDIEALENNMAVNTGTLSALEEQICRSEELVYALTEKLTAAKNSINENRLSYDALGGDIENLENERKRIIEQNLQYEKQQSVIRDKLRDSSRRREIVFREFTKSEGQREQLAAEHDRLSAKIWEEYELTYSAAAELNYPPVTEETRASFGAKQTELKNKLRALGSVNVGAIDEYNDVKQRYDFNKGQYDDLCQARESLDGIIERLEREMKTKFITAVEEINRNFKVTFKELFGGGSAEISLTDPENVLTSGIEINVAPPGKIIKNLISLSGGEQAFVAIALIFAILNVNPTPFCIFDEIESALDDVNVVRLAEYMKRYSEKTQFIAITHRRGTMEASDMLYGITMPDRGISRVLSMNVNEVEQKIGGKYN